MLPPLLAKHYQPQGGALPLAKEGKGRRMLGQKEETCSKEKKQRKKRGRMEKGLYHIITRRKALRSLGVKLALRLQNKSPLMGKGKGEINY